jgi:N-hydroxyarylamine O-acetyltransferase
MDLQAYLDRIGFEGDPEPDFATLQSIHRGHVLNIPFENLDVLFGRTVDLDIDRIFDKLVTRRRGGWCYEMNGLLGWALESVGFEVMRLAGGVGRSIDGDFKVGNHLLLLVDGRWIADVGFGNGLFEPVALADGEVTQRGFSSTLRTLDDGWWRYTNPGGQDFDFRVEPADEGLLQEKCDYLRTSPDSGFTQNLVAIRQYPDRVEVLRNSIRTTEHPGRVEQEVVTDAAEMVAELRQVFGIDDDEAVSLWPLAHARGETHRRDSDGKVGEDG